MSGFSNWYKVGTVTVTNGSAVVTGTGTAWTNIEVRPGDVFLTDGTRVYEILSVDSQTQITLAGTWTGATASGQTYAIIRNFAVIPGSTLVQEQIDIIRQLRTYLEQHYDWQTAPAAAPGNPATTVTFTNWNGTTATYESLPQLIESLTGIHWDDVAGVPATFPPDAHTHPEITGALGSVASQSASSVSLTGGQIVNVSIDNSPVGSTTPSTGVFTALSALSLRIRQALGLISSDTNPGSDTKQITLTGGGDATRGGSVSVYGAQAGVRAGGVDVQALLNRDIVLKTSGTGAIKAEGRLESNRGVRVVSQHPTDDEVALFDRSELTADEAHVRIRAGDTGKSVIQFSDDSSSTVGAIGYDHALNRIFLRAGEQTVAVIDPAGMQVLVPLTATGLTNISGASITASTINGTVIGQTTPAAGFFTTISGALAGNANTATALQTTRSISLSGRATGTANFNGTANATINVTSLSVDGSQVNSGAVAANRGGTGQTSYTVGDILAASSATVLAKVSVGQSDMPLVSNGNGVLPSYRAISLAGNAITGNLPVSKLNGGASASTSTFWRGDGTWAPISVAFSNVSGVNLAGASTGGLLRFNGTVWVPAFLASADIPELAASKIGSGVFPAARLGSGTATASTALFGDGQWRQISGGSWGSITGTLTAQTDLVNYINGLNFNAARINAGVFAAARLAGGSPLVGQVPVIQSNGSVTWTTLAGGSGAPLTWGNITGTLANQIDLQTALNTKAATNHDHPDATSSQRGFMTENHVSKLNGIQAGATLNSPDSFLLNRASHTGTQPISSVINLQNQLDAKMPALGNITIDGVSTLQQLVFVAGNMGGSPVLYPGSMIYQQLTKPNYVGTEDDAAGEIPYIRYDSNPAVESNEWKTLPEFRLIQDPYGASLPPVLAPNPSVAGPYVRVPAAGIASFGQGHSPFAGYRLTSQNLLNPTQPGAGYSQVHLNSTYYNEFDGTGERYANAMISLYGVNPTAQGDGRSQVRIQVQTLEDSETEFRLTAGANQPEFRSFSTGANNGTFQMLHTGNIKTVNGQDIFGSGDIAVSGGGGGSPAGSGTEIQYRNGSVFGAIAGSFWNGSVLTLPPTTMNSGTRLSNSQSIANIGGAATLELFATGSGGTASASAITFHRSAAHAVQFGLDTDNKIKIGGYSMGTVAHEVLHAGNTKTVNGESILGSGNIVAGGSAPLEMQDFWIDETFPAAFTGGATAFGQFQVTATSSGSLIAPSPIAAFPFGVEVRSSIISNSGVAITTGANQIIFGGMALSFECYFRTPNTLNTNIRVRMGFINSTTNTVSTGVYSVMVGNQFYGVTLQNNVGTIDNANAVTISTDTNYRMKVDVNAAGNSATFQLFQQGNPTPVYNRTLTTGIPTSISFPSRAGVGSFIIAGSLTLPLVHLQRIGFGTPNGFARARG